MTSSSSLFAIRRQDAPLVLGQPAVRWLAGWTPAGMVLFTGRIEEAERLNLETLRVGEAARQPDARLLFSMHQFQIRFEHGRFDELEEQFIEGVARNPGLPLFRAMLALIDRELEKDNEAGRAFAPLAASRFADLPLDLAWLKGFTPCAQVAAHLGDVGASPCSVAGSPPTASGLCPLPP